MGWASGPSWLPNGTFMERSTDSGLHGRGERPRLVMALPERVVVLGERLVMCWPTGPLPITSGAWRVS